MTRTRLGRVGLTLILAASSGLAVSDAASAADCGKAKERYHVLEYDTEQRFEGREWVSNPGDRTMTATFEKTKTFTTSVNGSVGAEAKKVFGQLSVQLGGEAMWSKTTQQGYSETREVSRDKYGHMRYWTEIWRTRWLRYLDFERCPHEYVEEGKAEVVADKGGYYFWESDDGHGAPPPMKSRHYDGGEPSEGVET